MTAGHQPRRATARVITEEHAALGRDITSAQRTGPIPPPTVRGTRGSDATGMHPSRDELHTCGVTTSRAAYCWGWDWTGTRGSDATGMHPSRDEVREGV